MHNTFVTSEETPSDRELAKPELGGLRTEFGAFDTVHHDDYVRLFDNGLIIFDTNALLNLYRYTPAACADFMTAIIAVNNRIWIPAQVMAEFWRNRESALADIARATEDAEQAIDRGLTTQLQALDSWAKRASLSKEEKDGLRDPLVDAAKRAATEIRHHRGNWLAEAQDTAKDPLLRQLDKVLAGRVGLQFTEKERLEATIEANRRIEAEVPPGYEDKKKAPDRRVGDYFVWLQILRRCGTGDCLDVLFITGDEKPDWWRIDNRGKGLGPRPELYEELRRLAGAKLYMLRPDQFLQQVSLIKNLPMPTSSITEMQDTFLRQDTQQVISDYLQYLLQSKKLVPAQLDSSCPFDLVFAHGDDYFFIDYHPARFKAGNAIADMAKKCSDWMSMYDSSGGIIRNFVALFPSAPPLSFGNWAASANAYAVWQGSGEWMGTAGSTDNDLADIEI